MNNVIIPYVQHARNNETAEERFRFDQDVYFELSIEDDRNAETIAHEFGFKSKTPVERSFERLEELGVLRLDPMPNGRRRNCRYRKVKLTGHDQIREIDLFNAPHYENWNDKTRMQLIERYMRIGWDVVPLKKDLQPIMDREDWGTLATRDKLTMFSDQIFGVGMWTNKFMIVDVGKCSGIDTLIAQTPDRSNAYFLLTPMRLETRFVVLPPTQGYEWANLTSPAHFYHHYRELFHDDSQRDPCKKYVVPDRLEFLRRITSGDACKKYALPDHLVGCARYDHLFRHGRSLRACGVPQEEIKNELMRVNDEACDPPIDRSKLERIIRRVWEMENDPSFAAAGKKLKKA